MCMEVHHYLHRPGGGPTCSTLGCMIVYRASLDLYSGSSLRFGNHHRARPRLRKQRLNSGSASAISRSDGSWNLAEQPLPLSTSADASASRTFLEKMDPFYRFTRPYTIIGSVLGVTSASLLALQSYEDVSLRFAFEVLRALIPTLLMHIYVVGINQVIDVEIDKVNKPYLPLASGEISLNLGISLTILCAALAFALAATVSSEVLSWAVTLGFLFGSGYSLELPLMQWKKWGPAAAISILWYRTFVVQICTFLHFQVHVLKRDASLNKPIIFLSSFICILAFVVAIFKDIPDLEGDKVHGVKSFVVLQGPERVFWFCIYALTMAYSLAIIVGMFSTLIWAKFGLIIGHAIMLTMLWHFATKTDPKNKVAVSKFYMFIWKLLYAEFFLAQFAR